LASISVEWRGKPVWILRRTAEMLANLGGHEDRLADPLSADSVQPDYATNPHRSIVPEYLVVIGICTHLGCSPSEKLQAGPASGLGADWPGGFLCPCHGSMFNLEIPPHVWLGPTTLLIGEDRNGAQA
jgi:ubiquinol-cytochrome c reductase iron-sulfur subunit